MLSRREFLKLSGAGFLALALAELGLDKVLAEAPVTFQGRAAISGVPVSLSL
jgi:anaerobic selenocysteine-containing dehydrogenase